MKVVSLLQPWASLVVMGVKKIETRRWATAHRGDILIHSGKSRRAATIAAEHPFTRYITHFHELPFGAIIGKASITGITRFHAADSYNYSLPGLTLEEKAFGDYTEGRYGWQLSDPVQFPIPIPARGTLSIWNFKFPGLNEASVLQCTTCGFAACADYFVDSGTMSGTVAGKVSYKACPVCTSTTCQVLIS